MTVATLTSFGAAIKDRYPAPGERIKQYVIDERRVDAWKRETCPKLAVPPHCEDRDDDEAASGSVVECPSVGDTSWIDIQAGDGSCRFCEGFAFAARGLPVMISWLAARDRYLSEHPICEDRDRLSTEIAPPLGDLSTHPFIRALTARGGQR